VQKSGGAIVPYRAVVSGKLAKLFAVLSHPIRVRIVEELRAQDLAVSDTADYAYRDVATIARAEDQWACE
jgi:hypothetical protein